MRPLPLNMQTLYADLLQSVTFSPVVPASVHRQIIRGNEYLYAAEKHGSIRRSRLRCAPSGIRRVLER
jgi:hypothetical protein